MVPHTNNTALYETNFTISVDAVKNATTGISSADRWETVQVLLDENAKPSALGRPGHMFPLMAKDGGVLQRAGHTEASVDLAILAGLKPAALLVVAQGMSAQAPPLCALRTTSIPTCRLRARFPRVPPSSAVLPWAIQARPSTQPHAPPSRPDPTAP